MVEQEDATPSYQGVELVFPSGGASTASVNLGAIVRDSSVVPASGDSAPGDIRKATVSVKEGATTLCGPLAVALTVRRRRPGSPGAPCRLPVGSHTIDVLVDGVLRRRRVSQAVVQVLAAENAHVGGTGELVLSHAAGSLGPATGTLSYKLDAHFKVEKNTATLAERERGPSSSAPAARTTLIRSLDLDSVGVALKNVVGRAARCGPQLCVGLGDVRGDRNALRRHREEAGQARDRPAAERRRDDGLSESDDAIGISLWDGNQLLFSSRWNGGDRRAADLEGD